MNTRRIFSIGILMLATVALSVAQNQPKTALANVDLGKASTNEARKLKANATAVVPNAITSTTLRETLISSEVTIAPGDMKTIEANSDFTGAEKIAFSILTADANNKVSNIAIGIFWAAPDEWYTMTDFAMGSDIQLADSTAAFTTAVYAPYLKVVILNNGSAAIRIKQLTTYAVAR
jgi:hypothetical protein